MSRRDVTRVFLNHNYQSKLSPTDGSNTTTPDAKHARKRKQDHNAVNCIQFYPVTDKTTYLPFGSEIANGLYKTRPKANLADAYAY